MAPRSQQRCSRAPGGSNVEQQGKLPAQGIVGLLGPDRHMDARCEGLYRLHTPGKERPAVDQQRCLVCPHAGTLPTGEDEAPQPGYRHGLQRLVPCSCAVTVAPKSLLPPVLLMRRRSVIRMSWDSALHIS